MTVRCTVTSFAADGDPPVRGALHHVPGSVDALVLTHGAGSDHRAPMLIAVADVFARAGVTVLRCDLPFRQARASGPPSVSAAPRDRHGLANALEAVAPYATRRRFVGGHSYGGRQASMLLAEAKDAAHGLLLMSYPLHPPGKPERARAAHLAEIGVPTLFVHGTRDPFGTIEEIEGARTAMRAPAVVLMVAGAGHGLPAQDAALADEIVARFFRLVG
jgi:predicted alpha/beta-hydrolase family hydrolase